MSLPKTNSHPNPPVPNGRWRQIDDPRPRVRSTFVRARTDCSLPLLVMVVGVLFALTAWPSGAAPSVEFPSPLSGPGVGEIKKSKRKKVDRAWREYLAGDHAESRERARRAGDIAPARLIEYQILVREENPDGLEGLRSLCRQHPDYAAAWITLSIAAEIVDAEMEAIETARRGGALWPEPPWRVRADELYSRWVDERIERADQFVEDGRLSDAMDQVQAARELDPERQDASLIVAKILLANDRIPEASALLDEIPDLPEATFLQGIIAEDRQDWQSAMELYSSLPADFPDRAEGLIRAQIRWRLDLLPKYARSAMKATELTRADLAVILVSVRPQLETIPGDPVPVMSDIVDDPGQREIITVVRLGIMSADRREHRFFPQSPAALETVRDAIQRTRALLGLPTPVWCKEPDMLGSSCISITPPPSGGAVVQAVLDHASGVSR